MERLQGPITIATPSSRRPSRLAFVLLLFVFGAWGLGGASVSDAQDAERPKIALLPVVVHSAERPDYLRDGMTDMLTSRFIQEGLFEVIRIEDPSMATTNLSEALEAGREKGADYVLFGSFTRFGAGASLDMQAAAVESGEDGETLREIFVHSGSIGEVIPDLVDLVGKVTRFAVEGYRGPVAAGASNPPAAGGASKAELDDLRRRVIALEQALGTGGATVGPAAP
jgi:TolB-like protein